MKNNKFCLVAMVTNCFVSMVTGGRPGSPGDGPPGVGHREQVDRGGDSGTCATEETSESHLLLGSAQNTGR